MPVTKKSKLEEKVREAEKASEEQMNDLTAAIMGLGSNHSDSAAAPSSNTSTTKTEVDNRTVTSVAQEEPSRITTDTDSKDEKPGYVSLVIPNSLKKKWKLYSTVHGMSLTDCLKLGMKLLEEMEQQGKIRIEGGFLTINS